MNDQEQIPLPKSSEELKHIVEEIYQAKPWDGWYYKMLSVFVDWTLTILVSVYLMLANFFSFSSILLFFLVALLSDLITQKKNVLDKKMMVQEIIQQSFDTGYDGFTIVKMLKLIFIPSIFFFIGVSASKTEEYPDKILTLSFTYFFVSLLLFFLVLAGQNLKQFYINKNTIKNNRTSLGNIKKGEKGLSVKEIADGSSFNPGLPLMNFYLIFSTGLALLIIITKSENLSGSLLGLYWLFFTFLLARLLKLQRIGQYSAKYYLQILYTRREEK